MSDNNQSNAEALQTPAEQDSNQKPIVGPATAALAAKEEKKVYNLANGGIQITGGDEGR